MRLRRSVRRGLSLLEVIIALAVFLMALVGLGFLLAVAGNTALEAQYRTQAAGLCQSKLAEVAAGAVPLEGQPDAAFEEDPDYRWSLDVQPGGPQGLHNVTVTVSRKRPDGSTMECSLSQMVLDPKMAGSVHDVLASTTSTDSATAGASSPTTGGTSSGSPPSAGSSGSSSGSGSGTGSGGRSSGGTTGGSSGGTGRSSGGTTR